MTTDITEFRARIMAIQTEALLLKRELFDAGFQRAHNHVAEIEAEAAIALRELLADPPLDHELRGTAQ